MSDADLIFNKPANTSADLVFGDGDYSGDNNVTVILKLPKPTFAAHIAKPVLITAAFRVPSPVFVASITYDSAVDRPLEAPVTSRSQVAQPLEVGVEDRIQTPTPIESGVTGRHQDADALQVQLTAAIPGTLIPAQPVISGRSQDADTLNVDSVASRSQDGLRDRRPSVRSPSQDADRINAWWWLMPSQDMYHDRRPSLLSRSQVADKLGLSPWLIGSTEADPLDRSLRSRSQDAWVPRAGVHPTPPEPNLCYTPDPNLIFDLGLNLNADLLFICDNHPTPPDSTVIVPIKKVYMVTNTVYLKKVSDGTFLPTLSMSLSIDVESWTWGFSATLPGQSLSAIKPVDGQPVELEASVNGNRYRVLVENIGRDRSFGKNALQISGRGKSAILDVPYAPVLTFANSIDRTAQQLMADVLMNNGVPIGWDIDWQLEDWLVPAGVFNVQGSYIDGLNAIVGAAGAYLQPHPTDNQFSALLRYPVAPWAWDTVTPDFELPVDVTTQEGIKWVKKVDYNRVFVSGTTAGGILGQVTRTGTDGGTVATMVTDALITAEAAARQRGIAILSDTGMEATVSLKLPVLDETGIITPGKFVRYVDGSDIKIGIVRSTNVDTAFPTAWQTIAVETHET